jgi:hypothetical protein
MSVPCLRGRRASDGDIVVGCCVDVDLVDAESLSKCGFGIVWTVVAGDLFHPVQSFHKFLIPRCSKADNQMPQSISRSQCHPALPEDENLRSPEGVSKHLT